MLEMNERTRWSCVIIQNLLKLFENLKYLLRRPIRSDVVAALPNLDIKSMIRSLISSLQSKKSEETKEDEGRR